MPYICIVPRCKSKTGKAKNVSFHKFPRDKKLAELWDIILKREKPYTQHSKVCSLHFRPEEFTITIEAKNRGQRRTLRKDAVPSRILPADTPPYPYHHRTRCIESWHTSGVPQDALDPQVINDSNSSSDDQKSENDLDFPDTPITAQSASASPLGSSWADFFS